ncbi:hypothetical protein ABU162_04580 [Paenibacillus thiaminolyticus]|uniref:hypothetical protein n=1 Tax=Paenibacillus thiaminolyticus TaxID=49283 RepID=UPI0035A6D541
MNKNQRIVVEWLTNSELNYMDNLHELEGSFDESETAWDELEGYIHAINKRFGTDFRLNREPVKEGKQS